MAQAWAQLGLALRGEQFLIGYEMYNEPWVGDLYARPWLLLPSVADRFNIQPLYDRLAAQLRQADPQHVVFFESITFDNFVPVGFSEVPGGPDHRARSALSYHYYEPPDFWADSFWAVRALDTQRLQCGALLSEFAIYEGAATMEKIMDLCDAHLHSWASWEVHSLLDSALTPNYDTLKHVSRTYAQAVAGHALSQSFNSTSGLYRLQLEVDPSLPAPTEIYLNEALHYSSGFEVEVEPASAVAWKRARRNRIEVTPLQGCAQGQRVTLTISRKS